MRYRANGRRTLEDRVLSVLHSLPEDEVLTPREVALLLGAYSLRGTTLEEVEAALAQLVGARRVVEVP